jgi:hypothetical protein
LGKFGVLLDDPPHARKFTLAHNPTTNIRTRFVKRQAPKNMKKVDLTVKSWIITDPNRAFRPP